MADATATAPPAPLEEITREQLEVDGDEVDEATKKRQELEKTFWTRLAEGLAIGSAVLAILAIVFSSASSVTIVAGIIALGVAGLVVYQQELLQDTDSKLSCANTMNLMQLYYVINLILSPSPSKSSERGPKRSKPTPRREQQIKWGGYQDGGDGV